MRKMLPQIKIIHLNFLLLLSITVISLFMLSGCKKSENNYNTYSPETPYITKQDFLLNTIITINLYDKQDPKILDGCFDVIRKYEDICSTTSEASELYQLNHGTLPKKDGAFVISNELSDVIADGLHYSELSGGVFDISIWPASSQWDFLSANPTVPDDTSLKAILPLINYKYIHLNKNEISFEKEGMGIDLGGCAKGYIADRVKDYLLKNGVKSAIINLGGNVLCVGEKPDGTPFHVGIQKPFADRNETAALMDINDLSVVTSGVYERSFTVDGKLYHHILDVKTGYPVDNNLLSVTVISKKSIGGDGLTSSCFCLGIEKGLKLVESIPDTYAAFITKDYQIIYSKGFKDAIKVTDVEANSTK